MLHVLLFLLIAPGFAFLYAVALRPLLSRIPQFKTFYANANGFWAKVWAWCGNSLTILSAKVVGGIGLFLGMLDPMASALGDPDFKNQTTSLLQSNPKVLGWVMVGISAITIAARVRSIAKPPPPA